VNRFYEAHRPVLRAFFTVLARVHAAGVASLPREGGVVLVSNHLWMHDPWLLGVLFPRQLHFMAKQELFDVKPLGWYLALAGSFPVRRGENDRTALRHAESLLRDGGVVMIFPEGHRSDTAGAQAARAGAVLLASRTNSPIVPVGITGTEHLRLRGAPGGSRWDVLSWPRVTVTVGHPIWLDGATKGHARKEAADLVMRRIVALLPPSYHGVYAEREQSY
jgi:1-acyl-sn-glycerol-3-phosphate acyltransferase